jgi:hypothetical protein
MMARLSRGTAFRITPEAAQPGGPQRLWAEVDAGMVDRAAAVPLNNVVIEELVSERAGHFLSNPRWGTLIDQLRVP